MWKKKKSSEINFVSTLKSFGFQKLEAFNDEDVFIVGYPKSGNTLLQHIIAHLVFGLRIDAPKSLINSCVTEYYNNPYFFRHDRRHFFKSHELPQAQFKNVIYIIRDGREALRSYYYMQKNMNKKVSLPELYKSGGEIFVGSWSNHVASWTENKFNANVLFIKYEDIIEDKALIVRKLCDFLGLERSVEELKLVQDATSLSNMKQMEQSYSWDHLKSQITWNKSGNFVREGSKKGFQKDEVIKKEWIEDFNKISQSMLKKYNYLQ